MKNLLNLFFVLVLLLNFNNSRADEYSLLPSNEDCEIIFPSDTPFIIPIIEGNFINLGDYSNYIWDGRCDDGYAVGKGTVRITALGYNIFINGFVYNGFFIDKISVKVTKNHYSNNPIVLQENERWLYEYQEFFSQDSFDFFIKLNSDNYYQEWYSKYQSQILEQKQAEEQVKLKAQQLVEEKKRIEAQKQQEEQEQIKAQKLHEEQEQEREREKEKEVIKKDTEEIKPIIYNRFNKSKGEKGCHVNFSDKFVFRDHNSSDVKDNGFYNWNGECKKRKAVGEGKLLVYVNNEDDSRVFNVTFDDNSVIKIISEQYTLSEKVAKLWHKLIDFLIFLGKWFIILVIAYYVIMFLYEKLQDYLDDLKQKAKIKAKEKEKQEKIAKAKAEEERKAREKAEADRKEQERIAKLRAEEEKKQKEILAQEKAHEEWLENEKIMRQSKREKDFRNSYSKLGRRNNYKDQLTVGLLFFFIYI